MAPLPVLAKLTVHDVPGPAKVIVAEPVPLPVHAPEVVIETVPEVTVAVALYVVPADGLVGAVEVMVMVFAINVTVTDWVTCDAVA